MHDLVMVSTHFTTLFNIYNTVDVEKHKNGGTTFLLREATSTVEPMNSSYETSQMVCTTLYFPSGNVTAFYISIRSER